MRDDYGHHARIVHADRVRSGGIAGFFPKERYEVTVEVDDTYVATPKTSSPASSLTVTPVSDRDNQPLALLLAEAMNEVGGDPMQDQQPLLSTSRPAFADVLGSLANGLGPEKSVEPNSDQAPMPVKTKNAVATTYEATPSGGAMIATSKPTAEIETKTAVRPSSSKQLSRSEIQVEPPRPPRGAGQVLALVGEAGVAFNMGLELSRRMRVSQTRVLLASPDPVLPALAATRRLADVLSARKRSVKLLAETTPSLIAIELPITAIWDDEAVDWAREMVSAVGAVQVWAVVDATRKFADLSRWLSRLDRVNALAVHNAAVTDDLYPILDLGYPVAMLDDRPATSALWRSMLRASGGCNS